MEKIKDKFFDLIIIFGLIFLIMQISIITADKKDDLKSNPKQSEAVENSVQNTPPAVENGDNQTIQDEADKPVSSQEFNTSVDL